jgi:hypothetical protein
MKQPFKLEHVGQEEDIYAENEVAISGFGPFTLTGDTVEYHFREEEMSLEKAEAYIGQTLNNLSKDTIDDLCHKMCTFIARVFDTYPNLNCTSGLAEAKGNDILPFISASDIIVGLEWDYEDGVELNVKGSEVLSVTQYLGYGEFGIWDEDENST